MLSSRADDENDDENDDDGVESCGVGGGGGE